MGSTFCNLSIYSSDLAAVKELCPDYAVRSISDGRITVAGEGLDWENTKNEARRLSKSLSCHVISVEYFDDDYAEFTVYLDGKRVCRHIPAEYDVFGRHPGNSKVWAEQLGLSQDTEKILKLVFKETNPEAALHLLECILECPLWVDAEFMDSVTAPSQEYLMEYMNRKNSENKIKNQTKLILLDEVEGDFGTILT